MRLKAETVDRGLLLGKYFAGVEMKVIGNGFIHKEHSRGRVGGCGLKKRSTSTHGGSSAERHQIIALAVRAEGGAAGQQKLIAVENIGGEIEGDGFVAQAQSSRMQFSRGAGAQQKVPAQLARSHIALVVAALQLNGGAIGVIEIRGTAAHRDQLCRA